MNTPTDQLEAEIDKIKSKILNESVIPKREQLVEELSEIMYKKGFKEAEALIHTREQQARVDEVKNFKSSLVYTGWAGDHALYQTGYDADARLATLNKEVAND